MRPKKATQESANTPALFQEIRQPSSDYLIVPSVSSENRRYVPMGYISKDVVTNNAVLIIPNASLYHFGILESNVHMAWMRAVCGRLESRYRYSKDIVYNNFPWPEVNDEQREKIAATAQAILLRQPRRFLTQGHCILIQVLPTFTTNSPCLPSCAKRISKTTEQ